MSTCSPCREWGSLLLAGRMWWEKWRSDGEEKSQLKVDEGRRGVVRKSIFCQEKWEQETSCGDRGQHFPRLTVFIPWQKGLLLNSSSPCFPCPYLSTTGTLIKAVAFLPDEREICCFGASQQRWVDGFHFGSPPWRPINCSLTLYWRCP